MQSRKPLPQLAVLSAALLVLLTVGIGATGTATAKPATAAPDFGPNVTVFDPTMSTTEIEAKFAEIHDAQVDNEMGTNRYALYFLPGTYGTDEEPLQVEVGYYTEVAGLGASPADVTINGAIEVYNRCFEDDSTDCYALNNFWRGLSNLTLQVNTLGQDGCESSANMWAVSQAVSLRRVDIQGGNFTLMDYCTSPAYASGGFIADSRAETVINGSQQQWLIRNSEVDSWSNAVWNQVFSGVVGAPDDSTYPDPPYTTEESTPLSREKPYLYVDDKGDYQVRVPSARQNTSGVTWAEGMTPGRTLSIRDFFIADPSDSVKLINSQLARGKNLILTPGVYDIDRSIQVKRANAVVLGLGLATLTAVDGATPLKVADQAGVVIAGVAIDAGTVESEELLRIGTPNGNNGRSKKNPTNPTTLSDVYFRVGGPHVGKTEVALEVNSDNVLIDHTWVWRADHGVEGFETSSDEYGDTERWETNTGRNGLVVNGDHVTATGLFVEHFQEYNTIWNGENGQVLFFQNELPYDPPTQADWTTPDGTLGWAAYKVADDVRKHSLTGAGVYVYNRNNPDVVTENGYEVPDTAGVTLTNVMTKNLSGPGTINQVVNGFGDTVDGDPDEGDPDNYEDPSYVTSYVNGVAVLP